MPRPPKPAGVSAPPAVGHASYAKPGDCPECIAEAERTAGEFHPDSDVGPWDAACPSCGHLHWTPPDEDCPIAAHLAALARRKS